MIIVLLLCVTVLALTGAWSARRRVESRAWDRELAAAFGQVEDPVDLRHAAL